MAKQKREYEVFEGEKRLGYITASNFLEAETLAAEKYPKFTEIGFISKEERMRRRVEYNTSPESECYWAS